MADGNEMFMPKVNETNGIADQVPMRKRNWMKSVTKYSTATFPLELVSEFVCGFCGFCVYL